MGSYPLYTRKWFRNLGYAPWALRDNLVRPNLEVSIFPSGEARSGRGLERREQQMLAIGRALMSLNFSGRAFLGLAPMLVKRYSASGGTGMTVLLIEQDAVCTLKIAEQGYVMERGRIVLEGSAAELLSNTGVKQAYLGKARG
jgi:branched-chain amino acid transport system ATP-binding protein